MATNQTPEDRTPPRAYCAAPGNPCGLMALSVAALVWAWFTLAFVTGEFEKSPGAVARNNFRISVQLALLACTAVRLAWAAYRGEKGKGWAFYLALLFLAAPLWLLAESLRK